ncbi:MAG: hypothetical protein GXO78_00490 [Calditrichaeota bacterium]|nr:hypothetical protein [Calditrichota bacterium]
MALWLRLLLVLILGAVLLQCGGPRQLAPDEYEQLSPQDRILYLNRQIEKRPNDVELKKQLYREYLNLGMNDQALAVMEDILQLDPYQADVQYDYGRVLYDMGQYRDAYRAFLATLQNAAGEVYRESIANLVAGKYLIQQVTSDTADEAFPSFSPDGKKIVYQKFVNGNWDIYELDLETGRDTALVSTPADETLPQYAPDGSALVFVSNQDDRRPIESKYKVREIYLWEFTNGGMYNLTQSVADDWLPRFNHRGTRIVFVSDRNDLRKVPFTEKQSDIFIMEKNGAFQLELTKDQSNEGGPCFSVDDEKIYFHSNRRGTYDIFVMDVDGSHVMSIIDDPNGDDVNPHVSPDSLHLVFFSNRDGNYEIYLAQVDGRNQERLTFHPAEDLNPVFSPDGKTIAFHSNRNGNYDIFFINLEVASTAITTADLISRLTELVNQ